MIKSNLKVLIAQMERDTGHLTTYREISQATGLSTNTLSKFARDKSVSIGRSTLDKLCKFFNCQVGDLLVYMPDEAEEQ